MEPAALLDLVRRYESLFEKLCVRRRLRLVVVRRRTPRQATCTWPTRAASSTCSPAFRTGWCSSACGGRSSTTTLPSVCCRMPTAIPIITTFWPTCGVSSRSSLEETSEQIINLKDANGISALTTVYSMLTNRLEFTLEIDGEERTLTRGELMSHVYSVDLRAPRHRLPGALPGVRRRCQHPRPDLPPPGARLGERAARSARPQLRRSRCATPGTTFPTPPSTRCSTSPVENIGHFPALLQDSKRAGSASTS